MKTIIPINVTDDGCAYGVKATYSRSSLVNIVQGGEHFPCTGIIEIVDED